jgi:hypothetical protein
MWRELLGGAGIVTFLIAMFGVQSRRLDKKMDAEVCLQRRKNTDDSFTTIQRQQMKCQDQFKELEKKLDKHQDLLIKVDTILSIAAKKNGWQ